MSHMGVLYGGSPMSHVEFKKWQCPLSLFWQCPCRPLDSLMSILWTGDMKPIDTGKNIRHGPFLKFDVGHETIQRSTWTLQKETWTFLYIIEKWPCHDANLEKCKIINIYIYDRQLHMKKKPIPPTLGQLT